MDAKHDSDAFPLLCGYSSRSHLQALPALPPGKVQRHTTWVQPSDSGTGQRLPSGYPLGISLKHYEVFYLHFDPSLPCQQDNTAVRTAPITLSLADSSVTAGFPGMWDQGEKKETGELICT